MGDADAVVVGAGHNGLVAAWLLARAGLRVRVVESAPVVGGACRTEYPFSRAPSLGASTGAYLLGLAPPELLAELGLDLPLRRRDPHYFLPTTEPGRHLLLGADPDANAASLGAFTSTADARADAALQRELAALREDLAPTLLAPPLPLEEVAERHVRPELRAPFVDLCRGSVVEYLQRFGFAHDLLPAMYAVTDGAPGSAAGPDEPGSGANFLVHNLGRLPGGDGTWMLVEGGMGTVTRALADGARTAGATIETGVAVSGVTTTGGTVTGIGLADGRAVDAPIVLVNADPQRLPGLLSGRLPYALGQRLARYAADTGTTLKVNLALAELPRFTGLPEPVGQHGATVHLLPDLATPLDAVREAWREAAAGRPPDAPAVELYTHTAVDPSLRDPEGRHSAALFVQWVPAAPVGTSWEAVLPGYVDRLLAQVDRYAPGTSDLVVDVDALPPPAVEARFGLTGGHIFHVDHRFLFDERLPYRLGVDGLYACGAGCHPAGSVIGAAGHNAARAVLADTAG